MPKTVFTDRSAYVQTSTGSVQTRPLSSVASHVPYLAVDLGGTEPADGNQFPVIFDDRGTSVSLMALSTETDDYVDVTANAGGLGLDWDQARGNNEILGTDQPYRNGSVFGFAVWREWIFYGGSVAGSPDVRSNFSVYLGRFNKRGKVVDYQQTPVKDRADVGLGGAEQGLVPFSVMLEGGVLHVFCHAKLTSNTRNIVVMTADPETPWILSDPITVISPTNSDIDNHHSIDVIVDPRDTTKALAVICGYNTADTNNQRAYLWGCPLNALTTQASWVQETAKDAPIAENDTEGKVNYARMKVRRSGNTGYVYDLWYSSQLNSSSGLRAIFKATSSDPTSFVPTTEPILCASDIAGRPDAGYATMPYIIGTTLLYAGRTGGSGTSYNSILRHELPPGVGAPEATGGGGGATAVGANNVVQLSDGAGGLKAATNFTYDYFPDGASGFDAVFNIVCSEDLLFQLQCSSSESSGDAPSLRLRRSRGTPAAPSRVLNGNDLGQFVVQTWDETAGDWRGCAEMTVIAEGDQPASGRAPCRMIFTTTDATGTKNTTLEINAAGDIRMPTMKTAADDTAAQSAGVPVGALYNDASGVVRRRLA